MGATPRRGPAAAAALALVLAASATAAYALGLEPDGTHLRAQWADGGEAWLELDDRNVLPAICFVWRADAPHDGDSVASRILTRGGQPVVDLGTGDQWVDGTASGCEVTRDNRYRAVFARPEDHVVEVRVVDEQGTPATGPLRSTPLRPADQ